MANKNVRASARRLNTQDRNMLCRAKEVFSNLTKSVCHCAVLILFYNNHLSWPPTHFVARVVVRSVGLVGWVNTLNEATRSLFRINSAVCNHNQSWTVLWFSDPCVSCSCLSKPLTLQIRKTVFTVSELCLTFFRVNVAACC
jgi:hypothetical protein